MSSVKRERSDRIAPAQWVMILMVAVLDREKQKLGKQEPGKRRARIIKKSKSGMC